MRVYGEFPATSHDVEAPVIDPGTLAPTGLMRRWGWVLPLGGAVALFAWSSSQPPQDSLPPWVGLLAFASMAVAVAGMLLRYLDDRRTSRVRADRHALAEDSIATTGTVVTVSPLYGTVSVALDTPDGPQTVSWRTMNQQQNPEHVLPHRGHPVAAWLAKERSAVLLRYERSWAQDILDTLDENHPRSEPETR